MEIKRCDICGKEAIYYQRYNNKHLCKAHFIESVEKRFFSTVREFRMVRANETIAVALSGGKDSSVLLYLLSKLKKKMPIDIIAITIDEGIKGYRDIEIQNAKSIAKKLGIKHYIFKFLEEIGYNIDDIVKMVKVAPCSYCGVFRRRLLNVKAKELGADKLAVGHNLDDAAQTLLLNITRNEPLRIGRYLSHIVEDEDFIPRIRPLIKIPEKEVSLYAYIKGIKWQFNECPYAKLSLRYTIRKKINEIEDKHPGAKFRMFSSLVTLSKIIKKSLDEKDKSIKKCKICGMPTSQDICMYCQKIEELKKLRR